MYVCMYVCVYIYIYIYIYVCVYMYVCINIYIYMYVCTYMYVCIYVCMHVTCIYIYMCVCVCVCDGGHNFVPAANRVINSNSFAAAFVGARGHQQRPWLFPSFFSFVREVFVILPLSFHLIDGEQAPKFILPPAHFFHQASVAGMRWCLRVRGWETCISCARPLCLGVFCEGGQPHEKTFACRGFELSVLLGGLEKPVKDSFIAVTVRRPLRPRGVVYLASGAGAVERCATALLARAVGVHGLEGRGERDGVGKKNRDLHRVFSLVMRTWCFDYLVPEFLS